MTDATRQAALFDLDGTLTDPFEGITLSIRYAMEKLGRIAPAADDLRWCIGPPLSDAFRVLLDTGDDAVAQQAVMLYRERYATVGKLENRVIEGVPEMLARVSDSGVLMAVATSKLISYAGDILDHFGLRRWFQSLYGSDPDGRNADKSELIRHAVASEKLDPSRTVMIGDRSHDIVGANANHVASIGVLWGYGDRAELEGAGATHLAGRPDDLPALVRALLADGRLGKGADSISEDLPIKG